MGQLVYLALALVPISWWVLFRTRWGFAFACGRGEPADGGCGLGVSVTRLRYAAITVNGILCGFAGSYLVLAQSASFLHMTAGRGFMALAALIFGRWHPVGALGACLLFGFLDAAAILPAGHTFTGFGRFRCNWIQAPPYALTVVLLVGFMEQSCRPQSAGIALQ